MLERRIEEWRSYLSRHRAIATDDVDELEDHLRSQVQALEGAGLDPEEALLIAVKRMGALDDVSREFAAEYSERLWKRLVLGGHDGDGQAPAWRREGWVALGLAVLAAALFKLPTLFGYRMDFDEELDPFYFLNFGLFALVFLAIYFAWKRQLDGLDRLKLAGVFLAGAVVMNTYPFVSGGSTAILSALHLPIALWAAVGFAYVQGCWRDHTGRMNFVRFTGEWFIYYVLIALGGGVLMMFTTFIFSAIGLRPEPFVVTWVLPSGIVGAVVIAAWLVEAKQSVIENMAPVLTLLFTPLFTLALLAFLVTVAWTGSMVDVEREVLIGFDLLLVLVVGLILYAVSAREPGRDPSLFDGLQLALIVCALLVDALALWAILARISAFGFTPNRVAALGENLILVVNLAWSAVLYARFMSGRSGFAPLVRWQTACLPVYAGWAALVVAVFPLVFGFR